MWTKAEVCWDSEPKAPEPLALPPPKTRPERGGEGSGPEHWRPQAVWRGPPHGGPLTLQWAVRREEGMFCW